jgi:hypothetical protein
MYNTRQFAFLAGDDRLAGFGRRRRFDVLDVPIACMAPANGSGFDEYHFAHIVRADSQFESSDSRTTSR